MSLVRDGLTFLFGCRQAGPFNYGRNLQVVIRAPLNYRSTVDCRRVLVKKAIGTLGTDEDHEEGAGQEEY